MCNDISDASSGRLRDASTLTSSSSLDHLFSFSAYLDARLSESALRARVMARKSLTYTTLIIILLYSTLLMSLKRTAPNDLENYAQHSHASTHGYPCTPKRPRTSYDPLSPSRYHTNPAHYPAQTAPTAYPCMDALEEGPPAALGDYLSEPTWENVFPFQNTVRFEQVLPSTPAYQPVQAASSVPSMTPTYHISTSYNMAQPHFSHIPSFSTAPVPPVTPSTSTAHSALLAASFESPAFKLKLRDPDYTVFHLPPRPNDLPAAYALDTKTSHVSFWCSRCHTWVGTQSRDPSKSGPFTKHVNGSSCIAQYARLLGLQAPLFPGSCFSIDSALGPLPVPATSSGGCPGIIIPWADDIWDTYVWHQHAHTSRIHLPWVINMVDARKKPELIYAHSRRCQEVQGSMGEPCLSCLQVLPKIQEKFEAVHTTEWKKGTNSDWYNFRGLVQASQMLREQLDHEWHKVRLSVSYIF
jgi:hypothetical protein